MTAPGLDDLLAELWAGFAPVARSRVAVLQGFAAAEPGVSRQEAAGAAHKLAGALGSYGRPGSDVAARLEQLLEDGAAGSSPEIVALVGQLSAAVGGEPAAGPRP